VFRKEIIPKANDSQSIGFWAEGPGHASHHGIFDRSLQEGDENNFPAVSIPAQDAQIVTANALLSCSSSSAKSGSSKGQR